MTTKKAPAKAATSKPTLLLQIRSAKAELKVAEKQVASAAKASTKAVKALEAAKDKVEKLENKKRATAA